MAKCAICEKSINHGNQLTYSPSHNRKRSPRTWEPNFRSV